MSDLLRVKRGLEADLPELMQGEFGFCYDTNNLYIGGVDGNVLVGQQKNYVDIEDLGAKADGKDYGNAIQLAVNLANTLKLPLYVPPKEYKTNTPIRIPAYTEIYGVQERSKIVKKSSDFVNISGENINSLFIIEGRKVQISSLYLEGDIGLGVYGISFVGNTSEHTLQNIRLEHFKKAFYDKGSVWMTEFHRVHCLSCEAGFQFTQNNPKTTLTFINCWAENCGQAWDFYRLQYGTLMNCGADYCNYIVNNPYGQGYGSQAASKGVYNFNLCRNVSVINCGTENSFGNGAVNITGCTGLTINGLEYTTIKSEYAPDFNTYPNWGVGAINIGNEKSIVNINGMYGETFENTYVKTNFPTKKQYFVSYNHLESVYGANNRVMVTLMGVNKSTDVFGGQGDFKKDCLNLSDFAHDQFIRNKVDIDGSIKYRALRLTGNAATKLVIPITPQATANQVHQIMLRGIDNTYNNTSPRSFFTVIEFSSLNTLQSIKVVDGTAGITAVGNGANLEITLPNAFNSLRVSCEVISTNADLVNFLASSLA